MNRQVYGQCVVRDQIIRVGFALRPEVVARYFTGRLPMDILQPACRKLQSLGASAIISDMRS